MTDAAVYTIVVAALGVGAGAMRLGQLALSRRNGTTKSAGLTAAEWKTEIDRINAKNLDEKVLPILKELKQIAQKQNEIQQSQIVILTELVTVSRIGRR